MYFSNVLSVSSAPRAGMSRIAADMRDIPAASDYNPVRAFGYIPVWAFDYNPVRAFDYNPVRVFGYNPVRASGYIPVPAVNTPVRGSAKSLPTAANNYAAGTAPVNWKSCSYSDNRPFCLPSKSENTIRKASCYSHIPMYVILFGANYVKT